MNARDGVMRGFMGRRKLAIWLVPAAICTFAFWSPAFQLVTLVQRPYLQNVRDNRATLLWSARENLADGTVEYSKDKSYSLRTAARLRGVFPPSVTGMNITFYQYQADLTGLAPGTDYYYRVMMAGQNLTPEADRRFHTEGPGPFSFLRCQLVPEPFRKDPVQRLPGGNRGFTEDTYYRRGHVLEPFCQNPVCFLAS
jgi:hypothetical protein